MLGSESHTLLLGPRKTGFHLLLTKGTCGGFSGGGMGGMGCPAGGPSGRWCEEHRLKPVALTSYPGSSTCHRCDMAKIPNLSTSFLIYKMERS